MSNKFFIIGAIFIFVLLSGVWLSRTGRPLNTLILTIHKLISLSAAVYLVIIVYRIHQVTPLNPIEIALAALTILFFVIMVATGGLLSTAKTMPAFVLKIHQIIPFLVILSSAATLYLLLGHKQ